MAALIWFGSGTKRTEAARFWTLLGLVVCVALEMAAVRAWVARHYFPAWLQIVDAADRKGWHDLVRKAFVVYTLACFGASVLLYRSFSKVNHELLLLIVARLDDIDERLRSLSEKPGQRSALLLHANEVHASDDDNHGHAVECEEIVQADSNGTAADMELVLDGDTGCDEPNVDGAQRRSSRHVLSLQPRRRSKR